MGSVLLITFEVSVLHIVLDSLCTSIGSIVFKCEGKDTNLFSNIQIFNVFKCEGKDTNLFSNIQIFNAEK